MKRFLVVLMMVLMVALVVAAPVYAGLGEWFKKATDWVSFEILALLLTAGLGIIMGAAGIGYGKTKAVLSAVAAALEDNKVTADEIRAIIAAFKGAPEK